MSLYNKVHGMNPNTNQLLQLLGKSKDDFGRFRDVYIADGFIIVHTRCGGGNREDYEEMFNEISNHPWYTHDEDQDFFDCTYADIYFKVPDGEDSSLVGLLDQGVDPETAWNKLLKETK